jgi:hypothetical protein
MKPWRVGMRVELSVADTIDPTMAGRSWTGRIVNVYPPIPRTRSEGASIHLDTAIAHGTIDILVFRRNRPSLLFRRQFVNVVPCPTDSNVDFDSIDVLRRAIFIAELIELPDSYSPWMARSRVA